MIVRHPTAGLLGSHGGSVPEDQRPDESDDVIRTELPASDYSAASIQVLSSVEAVRKRPGMYVGSSGALGILHLAFELVSNAFASGPTAVRVDVDPRGITVSDDGNVIHNEYIRLDKDGKIMGVTHVDYIRRK